MDEIIPWLHQVLDTVEAKARVPAKGPWRYESGQILGGPNGQFVIAGQAQRWNGEHIAFHNPERVLRKVAAMRRLIHDFLVADEHGQQDGGQVFGYHATGMLKAIKHAATEYDDQPGYQESWRP